MSVKQSLKDNEDYILGELPGKFHDGFKKSIEAVEGPKKLTDEEEEAEILTNLQGDQHKAFKESPGAHKPSPQPSSEELLKQAKEQTPKEFHEALEKNWK